MRIIEVDHMVWGAVLEAHTLFLLNMSASARLGWSGRFCQLPPGNTRRSFVNRLITWNVTGINDTRKREEVVNIFKKGKSKLPAVTETKLKGKGKGEVSWS